MNTNIFETLGNSEAKAIMGGDPSPSQIQSLQASLNGLFIQNSNCTNQQWADFKTQLNLHETTNVGFDMLSQMANSANGRHISITGTDPFPGMQGGAQFTDGSGNNGGVLDIGNLEFKADRKPSDFNYTRQDAMHFSTIAHELYHAFIYLTTGDPASYSNSVRSELDAFLFEGMADSEIDEKKGLMANQLLASYTYWSHPLVDDVASLTTTDLARYNVVNTWYDMFHSKHFTVSNYNNLIQNFVHGSSIAHATDDLHAQNNNGSYLTSVSVSSSDFDSSAIAKFYNQDYSKSTYFNNIPPYPFNLPNPPSSSNSSSSYSGYDNSGNQITSNLQWLNLYGGSTNWQNTSNVWVQTTNNSTGWTTWMNVQTQQVVFNDPTAGNASAEQAAAAFWSSFASWLTVGNGYGGSNGGGPTYSGMNSNGGWTINTPNGHVSTPY